MLLASAVEKAAGVVAETNFWYTQIDNLPLCPIFQIRLWIWSKEKTTFAHTKHSIVYLIGKLTRANCCKKHACQLWFSQVTILEAKNRVGGRVFTVSKERAIRNNCHKYIYFSVSRDCSMRIKRYNVRFVNLVISLYLSNIILLY